MKLSEIRVGSSEAIKHIVTANDIVEFSKLSNDFNPIHLDEEFAATHILGRRVAHGMFTASFFSGIFGTKLPGKGCLYIFQNLRFKKPVYLGDTVEAKVIVKAVNLRKQTILFDTLCIVKGELVTIGEAEIYVP